MTGSTTNALALETARVTRPIRRRPMTMEESVNLAKVRILGERGFEQGFGP